MSAEHHTKFLQGLKASRVAVWLVARWLVDHGYTVTVNPTSYAPKHDDWREFADEGDLLINGHRAEVKCLTANFTSVDDWPFDDFIVCAKHAWDNADPKPYRICYLNNAMTHFAALDCLKTCSQWTWRIVKDSRFDDREQKNYVCDKTLPQFGKLTMRN